MTCSFSSSVSDKYMASISLSTAFTFPPHGCPGLVLADIIEQVFDDFNCKYNQLVTAFFDIVRIFGHHTGRIPVWRDKNEEVKDCAKNHRCRSDRSELHSNDHESVSHPRNNTGNRCTHTDADRAVFHLHHRTCPYHYIMRYSSNKQIIWKSISR